MATIRRYALQHITANRGHTSKIGKLFSPNVLIWLEIGEKKIRLAAVLHNMATLYEPAEVLPGTRAVLVISVDGVEERSEVLLHEGIRQQYPFVC
jgi:hypothetical protein